MGRRSAAERKNVARGSPGESCSPVQLALQMNAPPTIGTSSGAANGSGSDAAWIGCRARRRDAPVQLIQTGLATGGWSMNRPIFFFTLLASMVALAVSAPAPAEVNPGSLAEQDLAAQSRGDVTAALALYSDDAIVQYGGLCWTLCVGRSRSRRSWSAAWQRRTAGRSSAIRDRQRRGGSDRVTNWHIEQSGVDRVIVLSIYEVRGDNIAVVTLVGQRTDPQTARFIEWVQSQPPVR
jgi:hypothetical protein